MLYVTLFFESIYFPTIVALGMRGLGKYTKRGSGFIVGGVAGGACAPPLLGKAADLNNSTAKAMSVPLAFFVAAWTYALCVNFVPAYRDPADKFATAKIGMGGGARGMRKIWMEELSMRRELGLMWRTGRRRMWRRRQVVFVGMLCEEGQTGVISRHSSYEI